LDNPNPTKEGIETFSQGDRSYKEWEQTLGDTYFPNLSAEEKSNEQTIGDVNFPDLQKSEKIIQHDSIDIIKSSPIDIEPNRDLKSSTGVDAEYGLTPGLAEITTNADYVNYSPNPSQDTKTTTTNSRTPQQLNNLEYTTILNTFTNALTETSDQGHSTKQVSLQDGTPINPNNTPSLGTPQIDYSSISDATSLDANTSVNYENRGFVGGERRNKSDNQDLQGSTTPIPQEKSSSDEIAYRPKGKNMENVVGINTATLVSLARPIGLLKRLSNRLPGVGEIPSVLFNDGMPFVNEIPGEAGSWLKGSKAVIPLVPVSETQAGTNSDDMINYARHAAINGFRMLANNIVDSELIQGDSDDSETNQIMKMAPDNIKRGHNNKIDTSSFTKASDEQNFRGQINNDIGKLHLYSTANINKSPAVRYSNFYSYYIQLKNQIAEQNVGYQFFATPFVGNTYGVTEDDLESSLIEKYKETTGDKDTDNRKRKMIEQMISFEMKIFDVNKNIDKRFINPVFQPNERIYIRNGVTNLTTKEINGTENNTNKIIDNNINDATDFHEVQAFISSSNLDDKSDYAITERSLKANFIHYIFEKTSQGDQFLDISSNFNKFDDDNKKYYNSVTHEDFMSNIYSRKLKSDDDNSIIGKHIDITNNELKDKKDSHFLAAFIADLNYDKDNKDFIITDRSSKINFIDNLLKDYKDKTAIISNNQDYKDQLDSYYSGNFNRDIIPDSFIFDDSDGNKKSFRDYVLSSDETIIDPGTRIRNDGNEDTSVRRLPKDIWAIKSGNYKIDDYKTDNRDYSMAMLNWNIENNEKALQGEDIEFSQYTNVNSIIYNTHNKDMLLKTISSESIKKLYNLYNLPSNYVINDNNQRLIKDDYYKQYDDNESDNNESDDILLSYSDIYESTGDNINIAGSDNENEGYLNKGIDLIKQKTENYTSDNLRNVNDIPKNELFTNDGINKDKDIYSGYTDETSITESRNQKETLEITTNENKSILFSKTIFGANIKRHNINTPDADDKWWASTLHDKMSKPIGHILVTPNPYTSNTRDTWEVKSDDKTIKKGIVSEDNTLFKIPFQFNPEISGESRQAAWTSHTGYGRTNDFYIWNNTSTRQINFKTIYIAADGLDTGKADYKKGSSTQYPDISFKRNDTLEKNSVYNNYFSGFGGWAPAHIHKIIEKYRSLVLPMDIEDPSLAVPPVVVIHFNNMFTRYTKHSKNTLSRWICEDVSIEPIVELGFTSKNFPMGFEVSLTLKEIFNDWGDYQDIKNSYIEHIQDFQA